MYLPGHFAAPEQLTQQLLRQAQLVDLVTATDRGLWCTPLPVLFEPGAGEPGAGGPGRHGVLLGHVSRANEQWQLPVVGEAMVIVRGGDGYVSPSWYATKRRTGKVVPTWNYLQASVYGELVVHDDAEWTGALVRRLTERQEAGRATPWSVDDAPAEWVAGALKAIVGLELRITRIVAKAKLSQNRSAEDVAGVIAGFAADGDARLTALHARADPSATADPRGITGQSSR